MRIAKTLLNIIITGKLIDTEKVMISLEGGGWKSASNSNVATYPTSSTICQRRVREVNSWLRHPLSVRFSRSNTVPPRRARRLPGLGIHL